MLLPFTLLLALSRAYAPLRIPSGHGLVAIHQHGRNQRKDGNQAEIWLAL
jgi:hypothetical protein